MAQELVMKIEFTVEAISAARKVHECAYCRGQIPKGHAYTKIISRKNDERFPKELKLCKTHNLTAIPLGLVWQR